MSMTDMTLSEFASVLASRAPAPGGGGASALCGALAAALGNMVGSLTVGKPKYAANEPRIKELMAQCDTLQQRLLSLIDGDAEAFEPLAAAYAVPKDEPGRDELMEKCLRGASEVPMEIMELACRVIELQEEFAELGSSLAVSDAGTGAALSLGAMQGAALNVLVNTRLMKDREYADMLNEKVFSLMREYRERADRVYMSVLNRLK